MNINDLKALFFSIALSSQTAIIPAQAAIVSNPIPTANTSNKVAYWDITGIYLNVNGQPVYLGEYAQSGDSGIVFQGSTWEIKSNGSVIGHGYGRVSGRFYQWACSKLGC